MTMIDEETLRRELHDAVRDVDVSHDAIADILATAASDEAAPRKNVVPSVLRESGRPRTLLAIAAVLIAVTAIAVPLLRSESHAPPVGISATGVHTFYGPGVTVQGGASSSPSEKQTIVGTGTSPKIESTGTLGLTVSRGLVASTFTKLSALATSLHGLVSSTHANSSSHSSSTFTSGTMVLEVPQTKFSSFVTQVEHLGHATSVVTSSHNVTSQYVDEQASIAALRASLAQYLKIMTRATTITGILAVENQINTIQSQIEQDQAQLKVLTTETTYASLSVHVSETGHSTPTTRTGFDNAWHESVSGFIAGFQWIVRLAGPALFALLLLGALYEVARYVRRTLRRRRI